MSATANVNALRNTNRTLTPVLASVLVMLSVNGQKRSTMQNAVVYQFVVTLPAEMHSILITTIAPVTMFVVKSGKKYVPVNGGN